MGCILLNKITCILALGALFSSPLFAQSDDEWYQGKPIVGIEFSGLINVDSSELEAITSIYIGQNFDDELFQDIQRRLYALDYFDLLVANAERTRPGSDDEVIIRFDATENPLVDEIQFSGNSVIFSNELLDTVLLRRGDVITQIKVRLDREALEALYLERGFPDSTIEADLVEGDDPQRRIIRFTIDEGNQVVIRDISFFGNEFASSDTLRGVMQSKAQSILDRGIFQESALDDDRRLIERYYQEQGYIDAEVLDIIRESERDEQVRQTYLKLTLFINEGEQYNVGAVGIEGNRVFDDEELQQLIFTRPNDLLDIGRIEADYQRVSDLYYENGYIFNTITLDQNRDDENRTISYTIRIVERDRAHLENIIIRGNTKTESDVILRELPFEVGDIFSAGRIQQGILNLYNLRYFSNIVPETPQGSVDGLMDLIINVEEAQTADIQFGLTFGGSASFPISFLLNWRERNFLGRGLELGASASIGVSRQRFLINFTEPWLGGAPVSLGFTLFLQRWVRPSILQDILPPVYGDNDNNAVPDPYTGDYVFNTNTTYEGRDYQAGDFFPGSPSAENINQYGLVTDYEHAGGRTARVPSEYLMEFVQWSGVVGSDLGYRFDTPVGLVRLGTGASLGLEFIDYDRTANRPFNQTTRDNWNRLRLVNKLELNAALDARDIFFNPSSGYFLRQGFTFTGGFLFGDRHYIRSDSQAEFYLTLFDIPVFEEWNWKMVLAIQSVFSIVVPHFVVPAEYSDQEQPVVSTADLVFIDGVFYARGWRELIYGQARWNSWLELRMPIVEQVIWFDQFFEMAAIWANYRDIGTIGIENMRFGFGWGLRFTIPQFPLRLYLAKRFRILSNGTVEWQTGALFNADNTPGAGLDLVLSIGFEFL